MSYYKDNKNLPSASIIVPVYNMRAYIEGTVRSILSQSCPDFELIIVENGSNDGTKEVCRRLAQSDSRIILVETESADVSLARNTGIDRSRGKWISFVDADDRLHPDFLKFAINGAEDTGVKIVITGYRCTKDDNIRDADLKYTVPKVYSYDYVISKSLYQTHFSNSMCMAIFHRSLFKSLRFTPGIQYEDLDLYYRVFDSVKNLAYIPQKLYINIIRPNSRMKLFNSQRFTSEKVTDDIVEYMQKKHSHIVPAALSRKLSDQFNLLGMIMDHPSETTPSQSEKCWNNIKELRRKCLFDSGIRFKNRGAILLSYMGKSITRIAFRIHRHIKR